MSKILYVDPPSGWKYGFPKPFDILKDDLEEMLKSAKYPEKDMELALNHSRYFEGLEEADVKI